MLSAVGRVGPGVGVAVGVGVIGTELVTGATSLAAFVGAGVGVPVGAVVRGVAEPAFEKTASSGFSPVGVLVGSVATA